MKILFSITIAVGRNETIFVVLAYREHRPVTIEMVSWQACYEFLADIKVTKSDIPVFVTLVK